MSLPPHRILIGLVLAGLVALAAPAAAAPAGGQPVRIVLIGNDHAVQSGPSAPSVFTTTKAWHVVELWTYHWNGAKGAPPGTIGLEDLAGGRVYGPWQASGRPGQGGVPNAYWVASVSLDLPAGRYEILDSSPGTWAQNAEDGHRGMAWIMATPAASAPAPADAATAAYRTKVSALCSKAQAELAREQPPADRNAALVKALDRALGVFDRIVVAMRKIAPPAQAAAAHARLTRTLDDLVGLGRQIRARLAAGVKLEAALQPFQKPLQSGITSLKRGFTQLQLPACLAALGLAD